MAATARMTPLGQLGSQMVLSDFFKHYLATSWGSRVAVVIFFPLHYRMMRWALERLSFGCVACLLVVRIALVNGSQWFFLSTFQTLLSHNLGEEGRCRDLLPLCIDWKNECVRWVLVLAVSPRVARQSHRLRHEGLEWAERGPW